MSDLIERLRALDLNLTDLEGDDWRDAADAALLEAAQEIERLTNRVTMLRAEADGIGSLLIDVQQDCITERKRARTAETEVARLTKELEKTKADLDIALDEDARAAAIAQTAAQSRIKELEAGIGLMIRQYEVEDTNLAAHGMYDIARKLRGDFHDRDRDSGRDAGHPGGAG